MTPETIAILLSTPWGLRFEGFSWDGQVPQRGVPGGEMKHVRQCEGAVSKDSLLTELRSACREGK